jgi:hypothetical protein
VRHLTRPAVDGIMIPKYAWVCNTVRRVYCPTDGYF